MQADNPKILIFDIETTPLEAYAWGPKWQTNLIEFKEHSRVLSFSAKWIDGGHLTKGWLDYKGYKKGVLDDTAIVKEIWGLLNQADIVVAQNGRDFDIKIMQARFTKHKLSPPRPYKLVDPKIEAKKYLRLPSYSLDDIGDYFGLGRKIHHEGFPLWTGCMSGDQKAWGKMKKYNKQDVILLEKVYLLLRPWMVSHPNMGMYKKEGIYCPKCGSKNLNWEGWHRNKTTKYHSFSCKDCGGWGRHFKNVQEFKPMVSI